MVAQARNNDEAGGALEKVWSIAVPLVLLLLVVFLSPIIFDLSQRG